MESSLLTLAEVRRHLSGRAIRVAVSDCLLGHEVRWNGEHNGDAWPRHRVENVFTLVGICPEVAIGMGVPRDPIQLVGDATAPQVVAVGNPALDYTEPGAHVPFHVVGQHAQEHMRADPVGGPVEHGPHLQVHGLQASEGALDRAQALVGAHGALGAEFARGQAGAHDVQAVQRRLRGDGPGLSPMAERVRFDRLSGYAREVASTLAGVHGYVFADRSPSCGLAGVKVFGADGAYRRVGRGVYAAAVVANYPDLPAADAETLTDEEALLDFALAVLAHSGLGPVADDRLRGLIRELLNRGGPLPPSEP